VSKGRKKKDNQSPARRVDLLLIYSMFFIKGKAALIAAAKLSGQYEGKVRGGLSKC
jgi:hypothetical protein